MTRPCISIEEVTTNYNWFKVYLYLNCFSRPVLMYEVSNTDVIGNKGYLGFAHLQALKKAFQIQDEIKLPVFVTLHKTTPQEITL